MSAPKVSRAVMARLAEGGMSATTIATLFDLDVDDVDKALARAGVSGRETPEVNDIQKAMRGLALRVIEETLVMLDEASPAIKQRLLTNMFTRMIPLMNEEDSSSLEDLRADMDKMFTSMKDAGVATKAAADEEVQP